MSTQDALRNSRATGEWRVPPRDPPDPTVTVRQLTEEERRHYGIDQEEDETMRAIAPETVAAIRERYQAGEPIAAIRSACKVSDAVIYHYTQDLPKRHPIPKEGRQMSNKLSEATIAEIQRRFAAGETRSTIAAALKVGIATVHRYTRDGLPAPEASEPPAVEEPVSTLGDAWPKTQAAPDSTAPATACRVAGEPSSRVSHHEPAPDANARSPLDALTARLFAEREEWRKKEAHAEEALQAASDGLSRTEEALEAVELTRALLGLPAWPDPDDAWDAAWDAVKRGDATPMEQLTGLRKTGSPGQQADAEAADGD